MHFLVLTKASLSLFCSQGGNHACFGMYGNQAGDGAASIDNVEQISITADLIINFAK